MAVELLLFRQNGTVVSVHIQRRVVSPGDDAYGDEAWQLKERIRRTDGVLRQRRRFFENAFERSTVFLYVDRGHDDRIIGFSTVRRDGYILFLAVEQDYRGEGFGKRLVASAAEDYDSVSCHARTTNTDAIRFYKHLGFTVQRRIESYYEDGGDAYYLTLGDDGRLRDRIASLLGRS